MIFKIYKSKSNNISWPCNGVTPLIKKEQRTNDVNGIMYELKEKKIEKQEIWSH